MENYKPLPDITQWEDQFEKTGHHLLASYLRTTRKAAFRKKKKLPLDQYIAYCKEQIQLCKEVIDNDDKRLKAKKQKFHSQGHFFKVYFEEKIKFFQLEIGYNPAELEKELNEKQKKLSRKGKAGRKKLSDNVDVHIEAFIIYDQNQDYSNVNKPRAWQRYQKFSKGVPLAGRTKFYQLYSAYKKIKKT
jgi:hypothetical protein